MRVRAPALLCACLLIATSVGGGPQAAAGRRSSRVKVPSPTKALQTAFKKLAKSKSYAVKVTVNGGLSDKEDHALVQRTVAESYAGEVYGPTRLMHVPAEKVYRFPTKGVAYIDGVWRNILSHRRTVLLQRLFKFPEIVLRRALANAPRTGRWLDLPEAGGEKGKEAEADDPSGESTGKEPAGKTAVGGASPGNTAKDGSGDAPQPRIVRVEAPPKEALEHFLEVQNSGCMSAG
jgi:hypothetical protein